MDATSTLCNLFLPRPFYLIKLADTSALLSTCSYGLENIQHLPLQHGH